MQIKQQAFSHSPFPTARPQTEKTVSSRIAVWPTFLRSIFTCLKSQRGFHLCVNILEFFFSFLRDVISECCSVIYTVYIYKIKMVLHLSLCPRRYLTLFVLFVLLIFKLFTFIINKIDYLLRNKEWWLENDSYRRKKKTPKHTCVLNAECRVHVLPTWFRHQERSGDQPRAAAPVMEKRPIC